VATPAVDAGAACEAANGTVKQQDCLLAGCQREFVVVAFV
jgi:hypothetical protein